MDLGLYLAMAMLFVGGSLFALTVAYALWVPVRTIRLQRDLLAIASDLKLAAMKTDSMSDPAYRYLFASIIRLANEPWRTGWLPVLHALVKSSKHGRRPFLDRFHAAPVIQEAVEVANMRLQARLLVYLLMEKLSGIMLLTVVRLAACVTPVWRFAGSARKSLTSIYEEDAWKLVGNGVVAVLDSMAGTPQHRAV